jgi:Domain of unknown function (DU1801)
MAEPKTRPTDASVADFIAAVPDEARRQDCQALVQLMQKATGSKPVMWGSSIVGFGAYKITNANGSTLDWPLIGFSPRKNDLTLYLMAGVEAQSKLLEQLGKHKTGKSCLYLKRLADVDAAVLGQLIDRSVAALAQRRKG